MRWWVARDGRRLEVAVRRVGERFEVSLDGTDRTVELLPVGGGLSALLCQDHRTYAVVGQRLRGNRWRVSFGQAEFEVELRDPLEREIQGIAQRATGQQEIRAPIPGKVVAATVAVGDRVAAGQTVVVLEAMKMENQIVTEGEGTVGDVLVSPGTTVEGGQLLVVIR